ncbi:MAG TPA: glycine--tRNA ligase subunit beta [Firmicutes bacterium]|nr:glycine--tRNA ligase subunit beta [Bacillota bacterium]
MPDLLLEVGTEEIPAAVAPSTAAQLERRVKEELTAAGLGEPKVKVFVTPRRLCVTARGVPEKQADSVSEIRGPSVAVAFKPDGSPTKAAQGFARSQGVRVEDLVRRSTPQGEYVFATKISRGRPAAQVLSEMLPQIVISLDFPKTMRWGLGEYRFCRPIRWVLALFGEEVLPLEIAGVKASRYTRGHRVLSPGPHEIRDLDDYLKRIRSFGVMLDQVEREQVIREGAKRAAGSVGGYLVEDNDLLQHVSNLVEWPTAFAGRFDPSYLEMPEQVPITVMAHHQKCFAVRDGEGKLMPFFIAVRNGGEEYLDVVVKGNEKVIGARLADARFFYFEDLKKPLSERVEELQRLLFQEKLGTMKDKTERVRALVGCLCELLELDKGVRENAERAAWLCRADLTTNVVREFPELQGVMGRTYALKAGEPEAVAEAIYESYLPTSAGGQLPRSMVGRLVAIADKLDSLVGIFAAGLKPSGSQDPYALRRHGAALVRMMTELPRPVPFRGLLKEAAAGLEKFLRVGEDVLDEVLEFLVGRTRTSLSELGIRYDVVDAVLDSDWEDPGDVFKRAEALNAFAAQPDFDRFMVGFRRAANLTKDIEPGQVDPALFIEPQETALYEAFRSVKEEAQTALQKRDYGRFLSVMTRLKEPIDEFLDKVLVMCDDLAVRQNRLSLLKNVAMLFKKAADPGRLVLQ